MNAEKEKELIKHRCCFIGTNPDDLTTSKDVVISKLIIAVYEALNKGYTTFITGMSPGPDIWAASLVFEVKRTHPGVKLIAAVPYPKYGKTKDYKYNLEYKRIIERADLVKFISNYYYEGVLERRNIWMIEHSSFIILIKDKEETRKNIEFVLYKEIKSIEI